jgi:hypothetical protein
MSSDLIKGFKALFGTKEKHGVLQRPGKQVLQWTFLAVGPTIAAFKQCRPVIYIDGTFLTGKYKGTILIVVPADSNNQFLPLAITFAKGENGGGRCVRRVCDTR